MVALLVVVSVLLLLILNSMYSILSNLRMLTDEMSGQRSDLQEIIDLIEDICGATKVKDLADYIKEEKAKTSLCLCPPCFKPARRIGFCEEHFLEYKAGKLDDTGYKTGK